MVLLLLPLLLNIFAAAPPPPPIVGKLTSSESLTSPYSNLETLEN